jgi:hypothetical protein
VAFGVAIVTAGAPTGVLACAGGSSAAAADAAAEDAAVSPPAEDTQGPEARDADVEEMLHDAGPDRTVECISMLDPDSAYYPDGSDAEICNITLSCGLPYAYATAGCEVAALLQDAMPIGCVIPDDAGCGPDALQPNAALLLTCLCDMYIGGGRRPKQWRRRVDCAQGRGALGLYLAHMAAEEAASVHAFEDLHRDLVRLGAPSELREASGRAVGDELRHARVVGHLARRFGARTVHRPPRPRAGGDIESFARDNAVEGCVRETYGALLAHWQSREAADEGLRTTFRRIALDETRHAALAWAIARWADGRLGAQARARVARARRQAVRDLSTEVSRPTDRIVSRAAGLPTPAQAQHLLTTMIREVA